MHPFPPNSARLQTRPDSSRGANQNSSSRAVGHPAPVTPRSGTLSWFRDRDTLGALGKIATQGSFIGQAPLAIAVVMDNAPRPQLDAGRALQQMELMAWSQGIGMCFVGVREADQQQAVKKLLNIPEAMELITLLPFGYSAEGTRSPGTPRTPMEEIVHWGRFGEKVNPA